MVGEGGVGEARRVGERKRGEREADEVGVDVLRLVAIFEGEVLEGGVCGERRGEKLRGEEERWVWEDC